MADDDIRGASEAQAPTGRKSREFSLAGETFPTLGALRERLKRLLAAAPLGEPLAGADDALLRAALPRHPEAAAKIGPGVRCFEVQLDAYWQGRARQFVAVQVDGARVPFSYKAVVSPRPDRTTEALRAEVRPQVLAFRTRAVAEAGGAPRDAVTGAALDPDAPNAIHVDHEVPFAELVAGWLDVEWLERADVAVARAPHGTGLVLADADLAARWREYHARHARLRLVSAATNARLARRGRA